MTGCFFFSVQVNAPLIRGFLVGVGGGGGAIQNGSLQYTVRSKNV